MNTRSAACVRACWANEGNYTIGRRVGLTEQLASYADLQINIKAYKIIRF